MISGDPIAQLLQPGERPKIHPDMVGFYRQYIPFKLADHPELILDAWAAFEARDVLKLEEIICRFDREPAKGE